MSNLKRHSGLLSCQRLDYKYLGQYVRLELLYLAHQPPYVFKRREVKNVDTTLTFADQEARPPTTHLVFRKGGLTISKHPAWTPQEPPLCGSLTLVQPGVAHNVSASGSPWSSDLRKSAGINGAPQTLGLRTPIGNATDEKSSESSNLITHGFAVLDPYFVCGHEASSEGSFSVSFRSCRSTFEVS